MLRFAVICAITLSVLGLAFYLVVLHAQPPAVASSGYPTPILPTTVPSTQASSSMVGPGYKPWIINLENGKITSKFTAVEFTPQKDQSFLVDHPVSIFYLDKGQYLKVTGESGVVNCDVTAPKISNGSGGLFSAPTSSPKNGFLKHVRAELYANESATRPTQWMETDNIRFDNETLPTMYTESCTDAHGNTVPADQVPVTVRGDEYEFDGNGLTLIWDAEKRLQKLEIYHGKRLEIINPSKLTLPGMNPTVENLPRNPGLWPVPGASELASSADSTPQLSSTGRRPVLRGSVQLVTDSRIPPAAVKPVEPPLPYVAVFHDQVKIDEAARTMATADLMTVDFLQSNGKSKSTSAAAPAAIIPPLTPAPPSDAPVVKKSAATKPVSGPVTIYWTGPLVVTPLKGPPMLPLLPGQSIMRLVGSPAKLTPEGSEVTAASVTYRSPDGAVQLEHSAAIPLVHLRQDKGLMLSTGAIDYDPATSYAILSGASALSVPVEQKPMNVSWSQQGVLHVVRAPGQPNGVDHVDLTGDVAVAHRSFGLNSHELQLDLNLVPKAGSTDADEQLRLLTAIDNVKCQLTQPGKPKQEIDADLLKIRTEPTADKKNVFPREVVADGRVHAFDPDQSLTAGHLDALMLAKAGPATKASDDELGQAVDLESLFASSNVHVAQMKNDATADADQLRVTTVDGKQRVDLWGPNGAIIKSAKGSLTGPIVHLNPDRNGVSVEGAGSMEVIRPSSTTRPASAPPPRPVDISWTDFMAFDGKANVADVVGNVTVQNVDNIGTLSTMSGDKAHLDLVDIAKNDKKSPPPGADAFGNKQLKVLTLSGNVVGSSKLKDEAGAPLRGGDLFGDKLVYTTDDATAIIPGPGRLYVENHKQDSKDAGSLGEMAIRWSKQLKYNQNTNQITIDGDTRVGFEQEKKDAKPAAPMKLDSQQLIIDLVKASPETGEVKKAGQGKMQLSRMQSIGQVHFLANGIELYCDNVNYDPKTSVLAAKGNPGRAMNAAETVSGYFDELNYDTLKEEVIDGTNIKGKVSR